MPTYCYACKCGHEFLDLHPMGITIPHFCPECGRTMEKMITGCGGIIFKGSGFYETDYKKADSAKKAMRTYAQMEQENETKAREAAIQHQEILREEQGERKVIDFREDPNAKDIIKIGDEVKRMKKLGVPRKRIDKELNPEVAKYTKHKKGVE